MVPEGGTSHDVGTTFTLSLYLMNAKTGAIDTGASLDPRFVLGQFGYYRFLHR